MATAYKVSPAYRVNPQIIKRCNGCNGEFVFQKSHQGKWYRTDVRVDTLQNKITCRNWFHSCPPKSPAQPPAQPTLFDEKFNVAGIMKLFEAALTHLKYPKIRLSTTSGQVVVLRLAGSKSKFPGHLNVTDGEKFGFNKYFGRIDKEGNWHPGGDCTPEVVGLLGKLSDDPAGVAAAYGKLTGNCCFCNLPLTDQRSTDVGYGPVCADHYGLAWG